MYKVIVVDDEPAALVLLCSIIEKKCPDYQVVATAENGREGLEKVDELLPDLVISDVSMPIMNGIQLVSAIKEKHPEILSLIVSGYSEFEYAKAALQSGVCDYILKPVIPSEMKKTLDRIGEKIRGYHYHHRNALVHQICNGAQCAPEELKKYFQIICVGNPGSCGRACLDSAEKIGTERREFLLQFPKFLDIFNILLFMVGECGHQNSSFLFLLSRSFSWQLCDSESCSSAPV